MTMKRLYSTLLAACVAMSLVASVFAGGSVEIRLKDGSRWRGEVTDLIDLTYVEQ
ncbi:MAG: hypothetical protein HKO59_11470, partial [Phycisphaerales bacterium]|nr:hypothetical protein [Phycisphaerales bacterium]